MKENTELNELKRRLSDSHESSAALRAEVESLRKEIADMHKRRQAIEAAEAYKAFAKDNALEIALEASALLSPAMASRHLFPVTSKFRELLAERDRLMKDITF